jgi:F-type H+-transporting ATPase subunit a
MAAEFAPEVLFQIGSFPITNTIVNTLLVDAALLGGAFYLSKNLKKVPGVFQNIVEMVVESFYDLTETIAGKNTQVIFPYFMSFFLFILIANWSGLIPGIGTFGIFHGTGSERHFVPFIRNTTSDLNTTLGLALISLVATHILAIKKVGVKTYLSRYFSFNPINLYVGLLEIVSEVTKIISLSFRLFGNIFAGEVVLTTIGGMLAFLAPIPFVMLEMIVGLVQALVFSMLTMVGMALLMTPHHGDHEDVLEPPALEGVATKEVSI